MRKMGQWDQGIVRVWKESLRGTTRERVGKCCDGAQGFRSIVSCYRPEVPRVD